MFYFNVNGAQGYIKALKGPLLHITLQHSIFEHIFSPLSLADFPYWILVRRNMLQILV